MCREGKPGAGVNRYHRTTDSWNTYSKADGLADDKITTIAVGEEEVWFGTSDAGVARYNTKTKEWETYSKKEGLAHNSVLSIAIDGDLVWFGASRGLSRYDKTTDVWTTFTQFYGSEDM